MLWNQGPYVVSEILGPVTVKVKRDVKDRTGRIVHMNNTKRISDCKAVVYSVLAEYVADNKMDVVVLCGNCDGYNKADIENGCGCIVWEL